MAVKSSFSGASHNVIDSSKNKMRLEPEIINNAEPNQHLS